MSALPVPTGRILTDPTRSRKSMEPQAFAIFNDRFICTANKDGTIPLSSRIVAELVKDSVDIDLLKELVCRANSADS